jgi:hypothetical protein
MLFLKRGSLISRKSNGYLDLDKVKKEPDLKKSGSFFLIVICFKTLLKIPPVVLKKSPHPPCQGGVAKSS